MKALNGPYEPVELEKKITQLWLENQLFQKIVESGKGKPLFRFLEGPPTVNGFMHAGHARGRAMKDVVLRYKTMSGHDVWRRAGWDCQGLPVELEVEKKFGITTKKEIDAKIGLKRFSEECNALVDYYLKYWRGASERLGLSLDYDNAYETRKKEYIEFVWSALKQADEKGLLEEDFRVVPMCPRCGTSLSSHEVAQGYMTTTDPSIYVKYALEGRPGEYVVIWTTTPWTIPGDEAVSVHPTHSYARVKAGGETWIMAEQRVQPVMEELGIKEYEIAETFPGKALEGTKYVHPLAEEVEAHSKHKGKYDHAIICGEHVTLTEGTGCVHTAPAHGPEDFEIGKKYGIQMFCPVDGSGRLTSEGGKYAGIFVKDADRIIIEDLERKGLLLKSAKIEHEYPFCWRCDSPLVYLADKQWFLRVGPLKDRILAENKHTKWVPDWAGKGRFEDWLLNAEDWCISRSRIWGSPLNVWVCESCGGKHVVGSVKELRKLARNMPKELNLHRPWIDEVELKCPSCKGTMRRVEYVVDCWFDSGVAHSAALGSELLDKLYPYDFITEAMDQTRGWFYSLVFTGVMLYDKSPYRRVLCQGLMLDKDGQKMSKSKGNVVWALDAMDKVGADSLRLYELWKSAPWDSLAFDYDEVEQIKRQLTILWNIFVFATTYMSLDEFNSKRWTPSRAKANLRAEDKWLLSRTQTLTRKVTENLDALALHQSTREILNFITEDLSRFYIRLARRRTWTEKNDPDKLAAYATLHEALSTLLRLLAPSAPYLTEELYQTLRGPDAPESIHLCDWPKPRKVWLDEELEAEMAVVKELLVRVLNARQKAQLKLRWPLRGAYVVSSDEVVARAMDRLRDVFLDQANVKFVRLLAEGELPSGIEFEAVLNFDVAGPLFKGRVGEVARCLKTVDGLAAKREVADEGKLTLVLRDKSSVELTPDLLTFRETLPENMVAVDTAYGRIYLDVSRTPELLAESTAKEVIRRTQVMRKEMNLRVEEYIDVSALVDEEETLRSLEGLRSFIAAEVRAKELDITSSKDEFTPAGDAYVRSWDIDGEAVQIAVTRLEEEQQKKQNKK